MELSIFSMPRPILWLEQKTEQDPFPCRLFGFNNNAALFALIAGLSLIDWRKLLKVVELFVVHLKTFRAIPFGQFIGGDGQMAVPAAQSAFLLRQEDQVEMSA
jgi:hypothetical protein